MSELVDLEIPAGFKEEAHEVPRAVPDDHFSKRLGTSDEGFNVCQVASIIRFRCERGPDLCLLNLLCIALRIAPASTAR